MADIPNPKSFLDRYTTLRIPNTTNCATTEAAMTSYGSGWGTDDKANRPTGYLSQAEYNSYFKLAVRKAATGSTSKVPPTPILFADPGIKGIPSYEPFYANSFIRAFLGKGSPEEIVDTLRLAIAMKRIGIGKDIAGAACARSTLADYVRDFISLDCNGLVGNYYGVNPENSIEFYASPAKRRSKLADIAVGDAIVTVNSSSKYEHIALLDEFTRPPSTEKEPTCYIKICEWGQKGDETKHFTGATAKAVKVKQGPDSKLGLGFASGTSFRYFFAPPQTPVAREWGLGGDPAK